MAASTAFVEFSIASVEAFMEAIEASNGSGGSFRGSCHDLPRKTQMVQETGTLRRFPCLPSPAFLQEPLYPRLFFPMTDPASPVVHS